MIWVPHPSPLPSIPKSWAIIAPSIIDIKTSTTHCRVVPITFTKLTKLKNFDLSKIATVVSNFCLIGKIRHNFLVPRMIELACKTFRPIFRPLISWTFLEHFLNISFIKIRLSCYPNIGETLTQFKKVSPMFGLQENLILMKKMSQKCSTDALKEKNF